MSSVMRSTLATLGGGGLLALAIGVARGRAEVSPAAAAEPLAATLSPEPSSVREPPPPRLGSNVESAGDSGPAPGTKGSSLAFAALALAAGSSPGTLSPRDELLLTTRAREEIGRVTSYDNTWMETSGYPMGDIPSHRGACTDVVVRAFRAAGVDLQVLVHEDVESDLAAYHLPSVDRHIDHRRVTTLHAFFERNAMSLTTDVRDREAFRAGDVVFYTWSWGRSALAEHVAIVSDRKGPRGYRLLIQNGGPRPVENDAIDRPHMLGHYRALPKSVERAAAPTQR